MKGVFSSSKAEKLCTIKDFDIPSPGPDDVLIKNVAVASNPKDWKIPIWMPNIEGIEGSDVAGYVESVGSNVTEFKKGDKVAAMPRSAPQGNKWGAYAEYSVAPAIGTFKFETASFEDMATLPLAVMTAALGLFVRIGLSTPPEDGSIADYNGQVVVVNGASSSIGTYATQLAKHAGYKVVGIAGSSADVAREFGADEIVDYRGKNDEELEKATKAAVEKLGGKLAGIFDGVTTDTLHIMANVQKALGGGKMAHVLPHKFEEDPSTLPEGVTTKNTSVFNVYDGDEEFAKKWYKLYGKWTDEGKFKPNKVKIIPGGLDGVAEGMELLKNNKVNAVKLVYVIKDSKSL